ncbi:hypothetical protein BKA69DRAFT_1060743 [Paraphysoderma sedebokerense]|nr:hypothetical protein BKA69DRAFT_1060743 [Paraphysoderma sedebokerense]
MLQSYLHAPSNSPLPQPTTPSHRIVHLPLIAALRYFIIQTSKQSQNLTNTEILAFILSYLSPVQSTPNNDPHPLHSVSPTMTKRSIHHVAQFQNILKSLEMWAQVLSVVYPPPPPSPPPYSPPPYSPSSTTSSFIHHNNPSSHSPTQPNLQNQNQSTQDIYSQIQSLHTTFTVTSYNYFNGFSFYVYLHLLKGGTSISKILVSSQLQSSNSPQSVSSQSNISGVIKSKYTELVLLYQFITKNLDHCIDVVVWYPDLNDTVTNSDTFGLNDKEVSQTTKKQKGSHGRGRGGGKMKSGGYLKSRMVKDESRIDGGKGIKGGKKGGGKEKDVLFEMLSGGCSFYAG